METSPSSTIFSSKSTFLRILTSNGCCVDRCRALNEDQYNHITATYYLLAEKILSDRLCDKMENNERSAKRQRRLQPASDPFNEQIGVFMSTTSSK